jgi:hypothetical protein
VSRRDFNRREFLSELLPSILAVGLGSSCSRIFRQSSEISKLPGINSNLLASPKSLSHFKIYSGESIDLLESFQSTEELLSQKHFLYEFDSKLGKTQFHPAPLPAHSILCSRIPGNPYVAIPLRQKLAFLFDPLDPVKFQLIHPIKNHFFYGHGAFTQDQRHFLCAEHQHDLSDGQISVRDAKNGKIIETFSSHGPGPHEFKFSLDFKTLIVCNAQEDIYQGTSSLCYLEFPSGKLLHKFSTPDPKFHFRHLDIDSQSRAFIGPIRGFKMGDDKKDLFPTPYFIGLDHGIRRLTAPDWVKSRYLNHQLLSVALSQDQRSAFTTCPNKNSVITWNLETLEFQSVRELKRASGIAWIQQLSTMIATSADSKTMAISGRPLTEIAMTELRLTGPHLSIRDL